MLTPQQQEWYQKFLAQRQASIQAQLQALHGMQPWNQPGWTRLANPLTARANVPGYAQGDPQAGTIEMLNPGMGQVSLGGNDDQMGGSSNPILMQMLMSGATGFGGGV